MHVHCSFRFISVCFCRFLIGWTDGDDFKSQKQDAFQFNFTDCSAPLRDLAIDIIFCQCLNCPPLGQGYAVSVNQAWPNLTVWSSRRGKLTYCTTSHLNQTEMSNCSRKPAWTEMILSLQHIHTHVCVRLSSLDLNVLWKLQQKNTHCENHTGLKWHEEMIQGELTL